MVNKGLHSQVMYSKQLLMEPKYPLPPCMVHHSREVRSCMVDNLGMLFKGPSLLLRLSLAMLNQVLLSQTMFSKALQLAMHTEGSHLIRHTAKGLLLQVRLAMGALILWDRVGSRMLRVNSVCLH